MFNLMTLPVTSTLCNVIMQIFMIYWSHLITLYHIILSFFTKKAYKTEKLQKKKKGIIISNFICSIKTNTSFWSNLTRPQMTTFWTGLNSKHLQTINNMLLKIVIFFFYTIMHSKKLPVLSSFKPEGLSRDDMLSQVSLTFDITE